MPSINTSHCREFEATHAKHTAQVKMEFREFNSANSASNGALLLCLVRFLNLHGCLPINAWELEIEPELDVNAVAEYVDDEFAEFGMSHIHLHDFIYCLF